MVTMKSSGVRLGGADLLSRAAAAVFMLCAILLIVACNSEEQGSEQPLSPEKPTSQGTTAEGGAPEERAATSPKTDAERPADPGGGRGAAEPVAREENGADSYSTMTAGALSVEVPAGWGEVVVGEDSEAGKSWSAFAGANVGASVTAAPDLAAWSGVTGASGLYAVASRELAQDHTDDELVALGPNDVSAACEPGARSDFSRSAYTGRVQAWKNCGGDPEASFLTLAAAPPDRACVVLLQVGMSGEVDADAGRHVLDTFEADCAAIPDSAAGDEQYAEGPEPAPTAQDGAAGVSCSGFTTMSGEPSQWQAQQFYDSVATPEQRAILDPDGDGFACDGSFSEPEGTQYEPVTPEPIEEAPNNPAYPGAEGCVNPGPCGVNPEEDPGDNVDPETGLVVGDDTPDCATPEQVLASGLCKNEIVGGGSQQYPELGLRSAQGTTQPAPGSLPATGRWLCAADES